MLLQALIIAAAFAAAFVILTVVSYAEALVMQWWKRQ